MPEHFENPMGLMGFEFVEFASPQAGVLEPLFEKMGFSPVARHRSKDVLLYRQGDINFIVNREPRSLAGYFAAEHGPCACALAFRVRDSHKAYALALDRGAQPVDVPTGPMELKLPAIKGIGGAPLYLIDRFDEGRSIYDIDFEWVEGVPRHPQGHGLKVVDHLTHNVYRGRMAFWAQFYERLFNFREIRYFDIQGEYTGLTSKAMTAPDGKIRIPLNEEAGKGGSGQIEEFLMKFNGEGIQHVALLTDDIFATIDKRVPQLVSWNGGGFDLPVLHYRGLMHRVVASKYWDFGEDDREFRFNNYISRYHHRHLDLMDLLALYQPRANAPLDAMAKLCGLPGKLGMDGSAVHAAWLAGRIDDIRRYCETDVMNTYLLYCRYQLMRGGLTAAEHAQEEAMVRAMLTADPEPHWRQYLEAWGEPAHGR